MTTATTEIPPVDGIDGIDSDEWQLSIVITDAPQPVSNDDCDTSDGCESTCASACTS